MKLTQQQRHMAYMIMLAEWEEEIKQFMCGGLSGFCDFIKQEFTDSLNPDLSIYDFPELMEYKPSRILDDELDQWYWFDITTRNGQQRRIDILKDCIEQTYYKF